jgi:outer membrane protein insertion porin family
VNTFTSKRLQGTVEAEQVLNKASKMYYRFSYRRVQATNFAPAFNPNEAPLLSQPARVGIPGVSYIRDKRDNPLESTKGNYNTFDAGVASSYFGSQADFSRLLYQNSTYYRFKKKKYVFARSTRVGLETPFRHTVILTPAEALTQPPGVRTIPLPERFFSGGGNSLRGFGLNQAGPRDLLSGFPVGGSALFINNLELRLPPPTLPFFQDNLSFAFFHDAGNVFNTGHDLVHNLARWTQRNPQLCLQESTRSQCDFNYISQAVGVGVRYKTPIGPVRFDFGYNLNPPAFPSCQATPVFTGQAPSAACITTPATPNVFFNGQHLGRLNVYFSIGQTF